MQAWKTLRIVTRSLSRTPGVTVAVILTLALGIGASTSMFAIVRGVLLRPLPYDHPERIVRLYGSQHRALTGSGTVAYLNVIDARREISDFEELAAYDEWQPNLTGQGEPERLDAALVSADFFQVLGVQPAVGRFFVPQEDTDGEDSVVVLSDSLWKEKFAGDVGVVGRTISLNGRPHTIIGVAPRSFEDPLLSGARWGRPQLWRPLGFEGVATDRLPNRGSHSYTAIGRLREGVTLSRINAELRTLMARLQHSYPEIDPGEGMIAVPLHTAMTHEVDRTLLLLFGAILFAMVIVAANIGNLLLGRALRRTQEFALRTTLGATRRRLLEQIGTETMLLTFVGTGLGVLLALFIERQVTVLGAAFIPRAEAIRLDPSVVGFAMLLALVIGFLSGVLPALRVSGRVDLRDALTSGGARAGSARGEHRVRRSLVTLQVATALVLTMGAGLLLKSYWNVSHVDPGLDPERVLSFSLAPSATDYPSPEQRTAFFKHVLERLDGLSDVESAAMVNIIPLSGGFDGNPVRDPRRPQPPQGQEPNAQVRTVSPGYFQTMGIGLIRGRIFGAEDREDSRPVVIVNHRLAELFWPDRNPVGRQLLVQGRTAEIVGVVADVKHLRLDRAAPARVYTAYDQSLAPWQTRNMTIVLRAREAPTDLISSVRAIVREVDSRVPIANLQTMEQVISGSDAPDRFRALVLGGFALLAASLAAVGVYGVVSYAVASRRREIAIRLAIGAAENRVLRRELVQGLKPVVAGLAIGALGALATGRLLAGWLFQVSGTDLRILFVVTSLIFGLGIAATLIPARRAAGMDPMRLLREE